MKRNTLILFLCAWPAFIASAGTVQLWSGDTLKGRVGWDTKLGLAVFPDQGTPTKVDLAKVRDAVFVDAPVAADPNAPASQPRGAFLTNGDFIAGTAHDIQSGSMNIDNQPVPPAGVAWIVFNPIPLDKFPKVPQGRTGAILPGGDFFEGKYAGIEQYRIGIDSPLLGPQRFPMDRVAAVVMRDKAPVASLYVVTTTNGSTYLANDLKMDQTGIAFQDSVLGQVKLPMSNVREIASGSGRFLFLTDAQPLPAAAPAGAADGDAFQVQPAGATPGSPPVLLTRANLPVTYTVPAGLTVFMATVAVPKEAPAGTRFTFAVYGDGKFLIQRGLPLAAGDPPQAFRAELSNVHTLTLRAEPSFPGSEKIFGQWSGPMLFKP